MDAEGGGSEDFESVEDPCHRDDRRMMSHGRRMIAMVAAAGVGHGMGILEASEDGILVLIGLDRDLHEDEVQVLGVLAFDVVGRLVLAAAAADSVVVEGVLMTKRMMTKRMQVRSAWILILTLSIQLRLFHFECLLMMKTMSHPLPKKHK